MVTLAIHKPSKFLKCEFQRWHPYTFQEAPSGHGSGISRRLSGARDFVATLTKRGWGSVSSESRERLSHRFLGTSLPE